VTRFPIPFLPTSPTGLVPALPEERSQAVGNDSAGVGSGTLAQHAEAVVASGRAVAEAVVADATTADRETTEPEGTAASTGGELAGLFIGGLAIVVWIAFLPALTNGFVAWDDDYNLYNNPELRPLGLPGLKWAWTTYLLGVYQPLAWMLFEAEYTVGGLRPLVYHGTSILLHVANAIVLYILVGVLLARTALGASAAKSWEVRASTALAVGLFAVHPLRVEVVAWASCQPYLLCTFFAMIAVLAYLRACAPGAPVRRSWLVISGMAAAAAMLSKAPAIILPAVLVILDIYPLGRLGGRPSRWLGPEARRVWLEKLPFFALSFLLGWLAFRARMDVLHTVARPAAIDYGYRFLVASETVCFYLMKTLVPLDLTANYLTPRNLTTALLNAPLVVGLTVVALVLRRRWPGLLVAWAVYLVALAPSVGLTLLSNQLEADRTSYIPSIAGVPLLAAALIQLGQRRGARAFAASGVVGIALLVGLISLTWQQCRAWRSSDALWAQVVALDRTASTEANRPLGIALAQAGRIDEAIQTFWRAETLANRYQAHHPQDPWGESTLGQVQSDFGNALIAADRPELALVKYRKAIEHQTNAVRRDPDQLFYRVLLSGHYSNLALAQWKMGQRDQALNSIDQARDLLAGMGPTSPQLGLVQRLVGHIEHLLQELQRSPEPSVEPLGIPRLPWQ
jgi:protein O-mannosyl-transferase